MRWLVVVWLRLLLLLLMVAVCRIVMVARDAVG